MTTSDFAEASAIRTRSQPQTFDAKIPDGWQQGKGAFGGLVVAILGRALVYSEADRARTLRSISADLCAPAMPGPAFVRVTTLRRGASMTFLDAVLSQDGAVIARANAALASKRELAEPAIRTPSPARGRWEDAPVLPIAPPLGPVFGRHYEYRSNGPLPFTGGTEARAEGWIRETNPPAELDEASMIGLCDAYWPSALALESSPRAAATVGFTMQLLVDPRKLDPSERLFYRAQGMAAHDNYFVEMRELWSGDRIVALNQQTFAFLT